MTFCVLQTVSVNGRALGIQDVVLGEAGPSLSKVEDGAGHD
jgi:hypothetical protein